MVITVFAFVIPETRKSENDQIKQNNIRTIISLRQNIGKQQQLVTQETKPVLDLGTC